MAALSPSVRLLNWSSGKDAAYSLWLLRREDRPVNALLTTVSSPDGRISMHGVRMALLERQAAAIGLPLHTVSLPENCGMQHYNELMQAALDQYKGHQHRIAVFGDIYLEDLRRYREEQLTKAGFTAEFPLWKMNTSVLAREVIGAGFRAVVVCVNARLLDKSFAGRQYDTEFLQDLPPGIDPCGENGEFHTFVYDGPIFSHPLRVRNGKTVYHTYPREKEQQYDNGFYFTDVLPY